MNKLTKDQIEAFSQVGEAYCEGKRWAALKKSVMPNLVDAITNNHDALVEGVTIGNYHFKLVVREELTAIEVGKGAK